jgi:hypothetical protein
VWWNCSIVSEQMRKEQVRVTARMDAVEIRARYERGAARACARTASAPRKATRSRLIPRVERHAPVQEPGAHGGQLRSRLMRQVARTRLRGARNDRCVGSRYLGLPALHESYRRPA